MDDSDDSVTVGGAIRLDGDVLGLGVLFEIVERMKVVHGDVVVEGVIHWLMHIQVLES